MMNKEINLIYGKNPVIEAIKAKKALKVFVITNFNDQKILNLIKEVSWSSSRRGRRT